MVRKLLGVWICVVVGCANEPESSVTETERSTPVVATTSYPARWLTEELAPAEATLVHIAPEGEDPTRWHPDGDTVARISKASLVVTNGHGYEAWLGTVALPQGRVVESAKAVLGLQLEGNTHSHGKGGEHSHAALDPHTWMDPHSYGLQAKEVSDALVRVYPESKAEIAGNYSSLATKLDQLDKRTAAAVEAVGAMDFASNHPSYNYLFRRYGKSVRVFDVNPTENPDVALRLSITGWAAEVGMPVLLWESKPSESVVGLLPGMRHVVVDPLEQPVSGRYDYLQQANANLTVWRSLLGDLADQGLGGE